MKKIIFFIMSVLLISSASALSIKSIRYFEDMFLINVHNEAEDLEDLNVRVMVINDDFIVYRTRSFDLDNNENKGVYVMVDEPVTEGVIKVTVSNDDKRKVKYIII